MLQILALITSERELRRRSDGRMNVAVKLFSSDGLKIFVTFANVC